jgi:mercuric ion transport protein
MRASTATMAGSVIGGVLASACCIGPVVFALLGISGAAAAQRLEPLRPFLLGATYLLLGGAFYFTYRPEPAACGPARVCAMPRTNRIGRVMLWLAAVVVVLSTTFPWYAEYLPF